VRRIETVRGPIDSTALGTTLMHEHLFLGHPELELKYPGEFVSEDEMVAVTQDGLQRLSELGVDIVVDVTDAGREPASRALVRR
jgi:phosphotriesterase-related protein